MHEIYKELFQTSQKEKRGLTFYVNGQTIPGVVTKIVNDQVVEVHNQIHDRVVILVDRIDALALT